MTEGYRWIWINESYIVGHNPTASEPWVLWRRDRDGGPVNGRYGDSLNYVLEGIKNDRRNIQNWRSG